MNLPTEQQLALLHDTYRSMTGMDYPLTFGARACWERWLFSGFTQNDLPLVISYIKRRIKAGKRQKESFKFILLIGDTDRFADDLAMARSESRERKPFDPARQSVLRASGREQRPITEKVKSAADILRESEALANLRKFRDSL